MTDDTPTEPFDVTEDGFLGGRLRLRQPRRGHRAGHDALLLAAATPARAGNRVVEFGAGAGAAGFSLASRVAGLDLVLAEIDPRLASLARSNAEANRLAARIVVLDVGAGAEAFAACGLGPDSADAVLMNPPFNDPARHRPSPDAGRRMAHMAHGATLATWAHAARRMLKSGGVLTLIWRADGLAEVIAALDRGFGSLAILPVHPDAAAPAIRVLVAAVKGGRAPLVMRPGIVLRRDDGLTPPGVQALLDGTAGLPLAQTTGCPETA